VELLQVQETSEPREFRLVGELDLSTVEVLLVVERLTPSGDVTLDLAELRFLDAAGLESLRRIARHITGHLVIQNPRLSIEKLIRRMAARDRLEILVLRSTGPIGEGPVIEALPEDLTKTLVTAHSPESLCRWLVAAVCREIPDSDFVGITLWQDGHPDVPAFSHQAAADLEGVQIKSGEGPGLDAIRDVQVTQSRSLIQERRWREFSNYALYGGVVCVVAIPLVVEREAFGALSLYCQKEDVFDDQSIEDAADLAGQAAVAIANALHYWNAKELIRQLQEALESRAVIDQAKGILMAREGVSADEAFRTLRKASQRGNMKVRELAQRVLDGVAQPPSSKHVGSLKLPS